MSQVTVEQAFQIALQCHQTGRLAEAEHLYRQILSLLPGHPGAVHYLGVLTHQTGRHEEALKLLQRAVQLTPTDAAVHDHLGLALCAARRPLEAIVHGRQAVALNPGDIGAHYNLGVALKEARQLPEAVAEFQQAVDLKPDWIDAHNNLIVALIELREIDRAVTAGRRAVALLPQVPEAHVCLGNALGAVRQLEESEAEFQTAMALRPGWPEAYVGLAAGLRENGQIDRSIQLLHEAIALNPQNAEVHYNLGLSLERRGDWQSALSAYRQAIVLDGNLPGPHFAIGMLLLLLGEFAEGWREYEWRWKLNQFWDIAHVTWDGSELKGRTIVLHHEQGFGDMIQFSRYIPMITARGGRVVLTAPPQVKRLLARVDGVELCLEPGAPLPPADFHVPIMGLPLIFNTTLETIPNPGAYLSAETSAVEKWRLELSNDPAPLKVGLVWAGRAAHGNDANRSVPLATFAPLAEVPGISFYSLQFGPPADQAKSPPTGLRLIDHTGELHDFLDTAALIANLDLVISVDTAIVHLAGAMGKPVWTLLPKHPDWRWLLDRIDSPWYPSMRLFRQPEAGDWNSVIWAVVTSLRTQLGTCV
jgi:Flp pilus assembly protein TadD